MSELTQQPLGSTLYFNFTSAVNGVPTSLSTTSVISAFLNSTTPITAGITLTSTYAGNTGMNNVSIVASTANGYAAEVLYSVMITTGTLGGISMVGYNIGSFQLTTEQTNINYTGRTIARGIVTTGGSTVSVPTSALTIAGASATGVSANQFANRTALFDGDTTTTGLRGAAAAISANSSSSTPTLTVGNLPATPASGDTFSII